MSRTAISQKRKSEEAPMDHRLSLACLALPILFASGLNPALGGDQSADDSLDATQSVITGTAFSEEAVAEGSMAESPATGVACESGPSCFEALLQSPSLTGDWGGLRSSLAENGIIYQGYLTQFYQGVASGGNEQQFRYGGKSEGFFTFLGDKLGLWQGLIVSMHTETRFGQDSNFDAVGFSPVNTNMLWPSLDQTTAITNFTVTQMLSEEWAVTAGKMNTLDLFNSMYPQGGRGIDGFMNISTMFPLSAARPLNLSVNGFGISKLHEGKVQGSLAVVDTNNSSTTVGVGNMFDRGAVIIGYWRHFTEVLGMPGSHALMGEYSTRNFTSLDRSDFYFVPDVGLVIGKQSGTWSINYFGEQQVWVDACNPNRNVGLFTSWGISDGNPNPIRWAGTVSLQARGLVETRPADSMGVAYFYTGLSQEFKDLVQPIVNLQDTQGGELYYNIAVTPWFNLTPDLQVLQSSTAGKDTAIVIGARAKLTF